MNPLFQQTSKRNELLQHIRENTEVDQIPFADGTSNPQKITNKSAVDGTPANSSDFTGML